MHGCPCISRWSGSVGVLLSKMPGRPFIILCRLRQYRIEATCLFPPGHLPWTGWLHHLKALSIGGVSACSGYRRLSVKNNSSYSNWPLNRTVHAPHWAIPHAKFCSNQNPNDRRKTHNRGGVFRNILHFWNSIYFDVWYIAIVDVLKLI